MPPPSRHNTSAISRLASSIRMDVLRHPGGRSTWKISAVIFSLLCWGICASNGQGACSGTSKFDGFNGNFITAEHQVSGKVTITSACTAVVDNFSYDGLAPAVYFWCSSGATPDDFRAGFRASLMKVPKADGFTKVEVMLTGMGQTWDNCPVFAVWCEQFSALLAHVELKATVATPSPAALAPANKTTSALLTWNCVELVPKKYNMFWKLSANKTSVMVALQHSAPTTGARNWMAFGFSDPTKPEAAMIGSDVVVTGFLDEFGMGFAQDYYLTNKDQCNYETGQDAGVCPDAGLLNTPSANNSKLEGVDIALGLITVTFSRPLAASDKFDHAWPTSTELPAVWAYGPLSEKSTVQQPVVLYHGATQRSDPSFKFKFGSEKTVCATMVEPSTMLSNGTAIPAGDPSAIKTIFGRTTFVVRVGSNKNYPNPPGWGYSFHINDLESPVLTVLRGIEYTFSVEAGDTHPLYITTDIIGGSSNKTEKIFAGDLKSFGTTVQPYVLKWTPTADTPDVVYYQCGVHQKFGWKAMVANQDSTTACSKTHPFVGFEGKLSQKEHGVGGTVMVIDDCTFKIKGFTYDGNAPAAEVYVANGTSSAEIKKGQGVGQRLSKGYNGEEITMRLPPGASWDKYSVVSIWCVEFDADFGNVQLKAANPVADCKLDFNGQQQSFDACTELKGLQSYFKLYLTVVPSGDKSILKGAMVGETNGWAAWGIPKDAGKMVGASAVAVIATPEGVKVDTYFLSERTVAGVKAPATGFTVKSSSAGANNNAVKQLVGLFEIEVPQTSSQLKSQPLNIIYATGPVGNGGSLQTHTSRAAATIDLTKSGASTSGSVSTKKDVMRAVHGYIMGITWGICIPLGIAAASSLKSWEPTWFLVHHVVNALAYVVGLAGFGIGLYLGRDNDYFYRKHYRIGIVVIILGGLQALSGWLRPRDKTSQTRRMWNVGHWWNGRVAAILAIVNIFEGFRIIGAAKGLVTAYWVLLCLIIAAAVAKKAYDYVRAPPASSDLNGGAFHGLVAGDAHKIRKRLVGP